MNRIVHHLSYVTAIPMTKPGCGSEVGGGGTSEAMPLPLPFICIELQVVTEL